MKFNEALLTINAAVMKKYPDAAFYEAQGYLVPMNSIGCKVDGTIDKSKFRVAYSKYGENKTILGSFKDDGSVNIELINDIWIEDIVTTPYIGMDCEQAIEFLVKKYGNDAVGEGPVTLRHQLFPGEAEPRYFFGTLTGLHTVNVYTGKIDVPAGNDKLTRVVKKIKHYFWD